jgi:hypothetical protein
MRSARRSAAPDKAKLEAFAALIEGLATPTLSAAAKGTQDLIAAKTAAFAKWVRSQKADL